VKRRRRRGLLKKRVSGQLFKRLRAAKRGSSTRCFRLDDELKFALTYNKSSFSMDSSYSVGIGITPLTFASLNNASNSYINVVETYGIGHSIASALEGTNIFIGNKASDMLYKRQIRAILFRDTVMKGFAEPKIEKFISDMGTIQPATSLAAPRRSESVHPGSNLLGL